MAGFYYLGDRDRVKCYYCNGGLQNWEKNDVNSHEHAKWYPLCEYLLRRQGVHFVKSVIKKYTNLKRPNITNPTKADEARPLLEYLKKKISIAPSFVVPVEDPRKKTNLQKPEIEKEMKNGKDVQIAISLGLDKKKIEYVLSKQYEKHGKNFASLHDLRNKLLDTSEIKTPSKQIKITQVCKQLIEDAQCVVCCKEDRCVLFMPCGYLSCCGSCSQLRANCAICQEQICRKIKTYKQ